MTAREKLLECGISPSVQRLAVLDYLLNHRTHPTADEIYLALCDDIPTLSKTTVYNTLKLFVDNGVALMLTINERNVHFDGDVSLHAHFYCKRCSRLYDMPYSGKYPSKSRMQTIEGHTVEEVHQYYKGICRCCLQQDKKKNEIKQ